MKQENTHSGILFIDRNHLEYFDIFKTKSLNFNFPNNLISDMEILNSHDLEIQLILFINFYKLNPSPLLIILSNEICFEIEINEPNESNFENITNNFLNHLPFEEAVHKMYKQIKGFRLVAINKEIIENFKYIFTKMGFSIEAVVPASVVGINIKTIDIPSANYIFAKMGQIKSLTIVQAESTPAEKNSEPNKVLGVKRIFLLLSVFLSLLLILLYMFYKLVM